MFSVELVLPNELKCHICEFSKVCDFYRIDMTHNISFLNSGLLKLISLEITGGTRPINLYLLRRQVTPLTLLGKLVLNKLL